MIKGKKDGCSFLLTARKGRWERRYLYVKRSAYKACPSYYLIISLGNWLEAA